MCFCLGEQRTRAWTAQACLQQRTTVKNLHHLHFFLPCAVTACTESGQERPAPPSPCLLSSAALPLKQPCAALDFTEATEQEKAHAKPAGVAEGKKVVAVCCAVGRGAAGSPTQQQCQSGLCDPSCNVSLQLLGLVDFGLAALEAYNRMEAMSMICPPTAG
eukprot:1158017-Pelagomonas_calceolata.AAC.1